MLNLPPDVEKTVRQYAERGRVSVAELIDRTFPPIKDQPQGNGTTVPADDFVLQFLNARIQEAENATPEEVAEANAEYRKWQENMNETRRINGERLLFPELDQP